MIVEIQTILEQAFTNCEAEVSSDGNKYETTIISTDFEGLNTIKRHQLVYKLLKEHITSGSIHALTIKAYTPEETLKIVR